MGIAARVVHARSGEGARGVPGGDGSPVARRALETAGEGRGAMRIVDGVVRRGIRIVVVVVVREERQGPLEIGKRIGGVDRRRREDRCPSAGGAVAGTIQRHPGRGRRGREPVSRIAEKRRGAGRRRGHPAMRRGVPFEPVAAGGDRRAASPHERRRAGRHQHEQEARAATGTAVEQGRHGRERRTKGNTVDGKGILWSMRSRSRVRAAGRSRRRRGCRGPATRRGRRRRPRSARCRPSSSRRRRRGGRSGR